MTEWNHMAMEWLSDYAPMGVFVVDRELKIRFWNHWMAKHTGKDLEQVAGKPLFSVCPEIESRGNAVYYQEALDGKAAMLAQPFHGYLIPMPSSCDNQLFECMQQSAQIAPLRENGDVMSVVTLIEDVTERRQREQTLFEERNRLAVTLRSIGDGVIATDKAGRVTLINRAAEEMSGWSFEEALGEPLTRVFRIINQNTRKTCENPVEKVLGTGRVVDLANHTVLISKDGTERMIADSGSPIRDREGNIYGVVLVFQDVTEKYRMEAGIWPLPATWSPWAC